MIDPLIRRMHGLVGESCCVLILVDFSFCLRVLFFSYHPVLDQFLSPPNPPTPPSPSPDRIWNGEQKLLPSNVKPFDRFGASVGIDGDALIVGSHQEYEEGNLAYQRAVQV